MSMDLEKIEQAVLRGLRKANWNKLEKRGSGETVAPTEGETGSYPKALPMLTDSPHDPDGTQTERGTKNGTPLARAGVAGGTGRSPSPSSPRSACVCGKEQTA